MNQYTVLAAFYDKLNAQVDYGAIHDFIKAILDEKGIKSGSTLLDLACGTGKLTNLFAADGYDMIGADLSPDMLAEAQNASMQAGFSPLYLCQDMRSLDLYGTVDAAFSCLDSLNYLPERGDLATVFSRLRHFIAPGGLFLFDVNPAYKFKEVYGNNTYVFDEDEVYCVWQNFYDEEKSVCDFDLTFFIKDKKNGYRRTEESQRERLFTPEEIRQAYETNGFSLVAIYGSLDRATPSDKDEKQYYVVQRNKADPSSFDSHEKDPSPKTTSHT
ncbi:MAG: class I SAM-dependent methyltransferase [Clostridia bacterium]|nr:class I SAM-dependent methyltransferase [Clostridia bacterium]